MVGRTLAEMRRRTGHLLLLDVLAAEVGDHSAVPLGPFVLRGTPLDKGVSAMISGIQLDAERTLFEVVQALARFSGGPRLVQRRHQHRRQNRDDGNND